MIQRIIQSTYRKLYYANAIHEEREALFMIVEYVLIVAGLVTFTFETWELARHAGWNVMGAMFWIEHWKDIGEFLIFLLLTVSLLAREVIRQRRKRLGYDFRPVLSVRDQRGHIDFDSVLQRVRSASWGYSPAELLQTGVTVVALAEAVASASAGILSERNLGKEDSLWFKRERDYLADWLIEFKSCIWLLPDGDTTDGCTPSGYASVIVPITAFSARSIRRGHRATDTAEIDPGILARFGGAIGNVQLALPRVQFLAYAQVCLSDVKKVEGQKLLTASMQHLAALLHGTFGAQGDFRSRWRFSVLCESANEGQEHLLTGLGFRRLQAAALDKERAHHNPSRSFAGFPLLELQVEDGKPSQGEVLIEAERFLACLESMVSGFTAAAVHTARAGSTVGELAS